MHIRFWLKMLIPIVMAFGFAGCDGAKSPSDNGKTEFTWSFGSNQSSEMPPQFIGHWAFTADYCDSANGDTNLLIDHRSIRFQETQEPMKLRVTQLSGTKIRAETAILVENNWSISEQGFTLNSSDRLSTDDGFVGPDTETFVKCPPLDFDNE